MSAENPPNYWEILEIPPGSSPLAIREAYTKIAKAIHPDIGFVSLTPERLEERNERMKVVNEAYVALMLQQVGNNCGDFQDLPTLEELENFIRNFEIARYFLNNH